MGHIRPNPGALEPRGPRDQGYWVHEGMSLILTSTSTVIDNAGQRPLLQRNLVVYFEVSCRGTLAVTLDRACFGSCFLELQFTSYHVRYIRVIGYLPFMLGLSDHSLDELRACRFSCYRTRSTSPLRWHVRVIGWLSSNIVGASGSLWRYMRVIESLFSR